MGMTSVLTPMLSIFFNILSKHFNFFYYIKIDFILKYNTKFFNNDSFYINQSCLKLTDKSHDVE